MLPVKFKKHEDMILNQHLKIVLTKKEHQELKKYCYERNMSMNDFVRNLIKKVINRQTYYLKYGNNPKIELELKRKRIKWKKTK